MGIDIWGGFPSRYVLEKLGVELRRVYLPLVNEALPPEINVLLSRLE